LKVEPAVALTASKGESADTPVGLETINPMVTKPAAPLFEIKCQIGLASCRRWIVLEEQRARLFRNAVR
jgi:hypothetical protein